MAKLKQLTDRTLAAAVILLMAGITLTVLWQVFTRYVLGAPSGITAESARFMLIWLGLLGASYVAGQRLHLAVDILPARLRGAAGLVLDIAVFACVLVFGLGVMVVGGAYLVYLTLTLRQLSPALDIPLGFVYLVVPLSGLLIALYSGLFIADAVRVLRGRSPLLEGTRALA